MQINITKSEKWLLLTQISIPLILLILGIYNGMMQTLYRSGMISQSSFFHVEYYQGLTMHGVINAIVLTLFFAVMFGHVCMRYHLDKPLNMPLGWLSNGLMIGGTVLAAIPMLLGKASVLYTFYPPLKAHPLFYLGLALAIVGSWVAFFSWLPMVSKWRKENSDKKLPLAVFATIINFVIWFVCTLAVAYEVLVLLLPWSLGWTSEVNVPLCRTLFWFFGHALVYFWLLPAYTMFYTVLPGLVKGKLFSDNAGRLVFLLFLIFSVPVGVHHQFSEGGINQTVKMFQGFLTYGVAIPSFITAFTIAATLEHSVWRRRGKSSLLGWIWKVPVFDSNRYLVAFLINGLILFIFGGLTGIVNASYNLNNVVHNTAWIPGHFHMTVAGPVFLAIIGMSIYIYSQVSGRTVKHKIWLTMVPHLWTIGILIFSTGLMLGGLRGEPRRTNLGLSYLNPESPLYRPDWVPTTTLAVLGGVLMTLSMVIFFVVLFRTMFGKKEREAYLELPELEVLHQEKRVPLFENLKPWLAVMILLIVLAYVPAIRDAIKYTGPGAERYDPQNPIPESVEPPPRSIEE